MFEINSTEKLDHFFFLSLSLSALCFRMPFSPRKILPFVVLVGKMYYIYCMFILLGSLYVVTPLMKCYYFILILITTSTILLYQKSFNNRLLHLSIGFY